MAAPRWIRPAASTVLFAASAAAALSARPITGPWPKAFPAKDMCSNCGLCLTTVGVRSVTSACAFIGDGMSRAESMEESVHGRARQYTEHDLAEAHFGVHEKVVLARGLGIEGAQWTGVTTAVAIAWLESGEVDAVVVTSQKADDGFASPTPLLARTVDEVLQGRRVKPSLSPALAVLDEIAADASIKRLLFCGVGCAVQALRGVGSTDGVSPNTALGLDALYVLGTHCVDNSPTPQAARAFVATLPDVGKERADDVEAYEFMADFRVHARLAPTPTQTAKTVKAAYMTLPPSIGIPSIAESCFGCFDYTNGLADLVVGYMGAPFSDQDEMATASLMVTVRNERGRAMLDRAVERGRIEIVRDGGHGGAALFSTGDRRAITMQTVARDSMVRKLTEADYVPADRGVPAWLGDALAWVICKTLPKGMEFARYSIDYHYLRNALFVARKFGKDRAEQHIPKYAKALMAAYEKDMDEKRRQAAAVLAAQQARNGANGRETE